MSSDPLGITDEARERGLAEAERDHLKALAQELFRRIRLNAEYLNALPDGSIVYCDMQSCPGHPVESLR